MPSLPTRFNWGITIKNMNPTLYNQLNDTYTDTARAVNAKVNKNINAKDPPANAAENAIFDIGDIWINTTSDRAWIMTSRQTNNQVTWTEIS